MLKISDLVFEINQKIIFNGLELDLLPAKINSLVGTTGAGKSVLLKILAGIYHPQSIKSSILSDNTSLVFQGEAFYPWLKIRENILKCIHPNQEKKFIELCEQFYLSEYLNSYPKQLSGGTIQKFNLIRAFLKPSELLLLDEPFSHLDIAQKEELYEFTKKLHQLEQKTILMVTHDLDEAFYLGHTINYLSKKSHSIELSKNLNEFFPITFYKIADLKKSERYPELYAEFSQKYRQELHS